MADAAAPPNGPFVLHVVPDSLTNQDKAFLGSTKDVLGRSEYFSERGIRTVTIESPQRSDQHVLEAMLALDLTNCVAAMFEFEHYRESLRSLGSYHPSIRRIVRAHNGNLPHFVDQARGFALQGDTMRSQRAAEQGLDRFVQDASVAAYADVLLPISTWEAENYWRPLARGAVITTPFFISGGFASRIERRTKRNFCVCMMGTGYDMTGLLYGAGKNFVSLVTAAGDRLSAWDFAVTGRLDFPDILGPLGRITSTGLLPSPLPVLAEAKAVAILSDWGGGFKTKILEAILAGAWVLLTPEVFGRLPPAVKPWCIPVDTDDPQDFVAALARAEAPVPAGDPNAELRAAAFAALDEAFAGLPLGRAGVAKPTALHDGPRPA